MKMVGETTAQEKLMEAVILAQQEAAKEYIKHGTAFIIGVHDNKPHVMLVDRETNEILKKINMTKLMNRRNGYEEL